MSSSEELASKTVSVTVKVADDTVTVDKTDLSKTLASAKQLRESDYTAASWKAFAATLASAEKVYADENASQKDVDDATAALNKAQAALVKVDGSIRAMARAIRLSRATARALTLVLLVIRRATSSVCLRPVPPYSASAAWPWRSLPPASP